MAVESMQRELALTVLHQMIQFSVKYLLPKFGKRTGKETVEVSGYDMILQVKRISGNLVPSSREAHHFLPGGGCGGGTFAPSEPFLTRKTYPLPSPQKIALFFSKKATKD